MTISKNKRWLLILLSTLLYCQCIFCASFDAERSYPFTYPFIKCLPSSKIEFVERVERYLNILSTIDTGKSLLTALDALLTAKGGFISIKEIESGGVNFKPILISEGHQMLEIEINLDRIENSWVGCIGFSSVKILGNEMFPIGNSPNPPAAVLGHELIHALHYLKNKEQFNTDNNAYNSKWDKLKRSNHHFKDKLDEMLWGLKSEEQYTVIGNVGDASITENNIRRDLGLPPRYAYQPVNVVSVTNTEGKITIIEASSEHTYFYENSDIITSILKGVWGDNWYGQLRELHEKNVYIWIFNEEEAKRSRFNPFKIVEEDELFVKEPPSGGASDSSLQASFLAKRAARGAEKAAGGAGIKKDF